ncbi:undecaprenyldiphospho-muramoylpentapeptide beta-N-acetylglucosaminyltransferase, partial [bacterium]
MRVVVTGGGTGGHVYPALEVARALQERGAGDSGTDLHYLGSLRGSEARAAEAVGIAFRGYPTFPLVSIRSVAGVKARVAMLRAIPRAKADLRTLRPDVVFSTGGYSSGPV